MNTVHEKIEKKYPQLFFLKHCSDHQEHCELETSLEEDCLSLEKKLFSRPQLLLLIGAQKGEINKRIKEFLIPNQEVQVVLFEENLESIFSFFNQADEELWCHERFHVCYVMTHLEQALEEMLWKFPRERLQVYLSKNYRDWKSEDELVLSLRRKATLSSSFHHEVIYYHLLTENLLSNFKEFPRCFYGDTLKGMFEGIPAVICGAGPSLNLQVPFLKEIKNKALIMGGGSTLSALVSQGVEPHIGFALDPNPEEKQRLEKIKNSDFPLLFGARLHQGILKEYLGPKGYLKTGSGGFLEQAIENHLGLDMEPLLKDIGEEGLSVSVLALSAAYHMGCCPIIVCGVDLAFVFNQTYAQGIMENTSVADQTNYSCADERIWIENMKGNKVLTSVKWVMEKKVIEDFAAMHPQTLFLNASDQGLGFSNLSTISLKEFFLEKPTYDIEKLVRQKIEACPTFSNSKEELFGFLEKISVSLNNCELLLKKMEHRTQFLIEERKNPGEDSLMTLYEMDLEEEEAFHLFLKPINDKREVFLLYEKEGITQLATLVEHYLKIFSLFFENHDQKENVK